jgi:hypothetical protein
MGEGRGAKSEGRGGEGGGGGVTTAPSPKNRAGHTLDSYTILLRKFGYGRLHSFNRAVFQ